MPGPGTTAAPGCDVGMGLAAAAAAGPGPLPPLLVAGLKGWWWWGKSLSASGEEGSSTRACPNCRRGLLMDAAGLPSMADATATLDRRACGDAAAAWARALVAAAVADIAAEEGWPGRAGRSSLGGGRGTMSTAMSLDDVLPRLRLSWTTSAVRVSTWLNMDAKMVRTESQASTDGGSRIRMMAWDVAD